MSAQIKFVCNAEGCPNQGVDYFWEDATETYAQCGGCDAVLEAQSV